MTGLEVNLDPVVQKVDSTVHWIYLYPVDKTLGFSKYLYTVKWCIWWIALFNNCMGAWLGYWFNIKNPHPFPCKLLCCSFPFNRMNPISIICNRNETFKLQNSQVREQEQGGKVAKWWELVRALASHQCGPGSKPVIDATRGLSLLLVLSLALIIIIIVNY